MLKLKVKKLDMKAGKPVIVLHEVTAKNASIHLGDRVHVKSNDKSIIAVVDLTHTLVQQHETALSQEVFEYIKIRPHAIVAVDPVSETQSLHYITEKMSGKPFKRHQLHAIVGDIVNNALTEAEIAYFVSTIANNPLSLKETIFLTESMVKTGKSLKWKAGTKIADKHSIGGIPANRTTPLVVAICAAAGVVMPKTSSRAITSAAGTADVIEAVARVDLSVDELQKVVNTTGACLAWGGSLGLAPADDKLIRVERLLNVDPESQLIASILAKKLSAGSRYILIDIPYGGSAKVTKAEGLHLKKRFMAVAKHFHLHIMVVLTQGSEPIGNGIGPILEMRDILKVLRRQYGPLDLEKKALFLAGIIFEMVGKAKRGKGIELAKHLLDSGKAYKKFEEIITAQGRKHTALNPGRFTRDLLSSSSGTIRSLDNKNLNHLCRILGCPADKAAGVYLYHHLNDKVQKGDLLITMYAESQKKLKNALAYYKKYPSILVST